MIQRRLRPINPKHSRDVLLTLSHCNETFAEDGYCFFTIDGTIYVRASTMSWTECQIRCLKMLILSFKHVVRRCAVYYSGASDDMFKPTLKFEMTFSITSFAMNTFSEISTFVQKPAI